MVEAWQDGAGGASGGNTNSVRRIGAAAAAEDRACGPPGKAPEKRTRPAERRRSGFVFNAVRITPQPAAGNRTVGASLRASISLERAGRTGYHVKSFYSTADFRSVDWK
jgi:hypothetical protein